MFSLASPADLFSAHHPDGLVPPGWVTMTKVTFRWRICSPLLYYNVTHTSEVIEYTTEEMTSLWRSMTQNYVVFKTPFCDVPSFAKPNH
jgi:hypothetical protein